MHSSTFISFAAVAIAALTKPAHAIWATFYDDTGCTVNGGIAVDTTNPGCLANEINRHSIYFQSGVTTGESLVFSPGTECDCQNECINLISTNEGCYDLTGHAWANSFRFIGGTCGDNNC